MGIVSSNRPYRSRSCAADSLAVRRRRPCSILVTASAMMLMGLSPAKAGQLPCDSNLVINSGCDDELVSGEIAGWLEIKGQWTRRSSNPPPSLGSGYFSPTSGDTAELIQDVDFSGFEFYPVHFSADIQTGQETPSDLARLVFEFRSSGGDLLGALDSGEIASPGAWTPLLFNCCEGPPLGTAIIRVRLIGVRRSGTENNAYFDHLEVIPICGLPAVPSTWGRIKALER
jgi:hypothetical protein